MKINFTDLLSVEVISVMHMLMFPQVCGDLSHFCVELHICVSLLPKHDGILRAESRKNTKVRRLRIHNKEAK